MIPFEPAVRSIRKLCSRGGTKSVEMLVAITAIVDGISSMRFPETSAIASEGRVIKVVEGDCPIGGFERISLTSTRIVTRGDGEGDEMTMAV